MVRLDRIVDGGSTALGRSQAPRRAGYVLPTLPSALRLLTSAVVALYCAPKALASVWSVAEGKKWVRSPPFGEMLVACAGTALLMHCFVHGPEKMCVDVVFFHKRPPWLTRAASRPSLARGVISQVVDPHFPGRSPSKAKLVTGTDTPIAIHRSPQGTPAELDGEPALQIRVPGGKGKPKFRV